MNIKEKLTQFFKNNIIIQLLKKIRFLGLDEICLFDVLQIYITGILKGTLSERASGIAYNLFMSAFPLIILISALLPYLPHYNILEDYIFNITIKTILPEQKVYESVSSFIHQSIADNKLKILSSSMILTIFFSTNGIKSLLAGFKNSYHISDSFGFFKQYLIALTLTLGFIISLFTCLTIIYYVEFVWGFVYEVNPAKEFSALLISIFSFLIYFSFFLIMYCVLYYFGSNFKISMKWSMPGAFLSSILFFLTIFFFGYYIKIFTKNNVFFGSIGSVIIVMIWIYINVLITLIGYELNLSIKVAKNARENN